MFKAKQNIPVEIFSLIYEVQYFYSAAKSLKYINIKENMSKPLYICICIKTPTDPPTHIQLQSDSGGLNMKIYITITDALSDTNIQK